MPWLSNWFYKITHQDFDINALKNKIQTNTATTDELLAYVDDIEYRIGNMINDLKVLYKKYDITFKGFKSFEAACTYLRQSIKNGTTETYNNLIKLESMVTSEQQRHLTLVKMAVTQQGIRVYDKIKSDPDSYAIFEKVFGARDANGRLVEDGLYQRLWSEIHKLSEYILINKNKVYH